MLKKSTVAIQLIVSLFSHDPNNIIRENWKIITMKVDSSGKISGLYSGDV
jgi:hypothetical protein